MKVCVCNLTIGDDYYNTVSLGIDSIKKYCERNNYHFYFEKEYIDDSRHIYWNKILLIQKCLRKGYDYVIWLDSDIIIMRMDILLEDIIIQYMEDKDFLIACDPEMINTGVWFCKNNKFVDDILTETYLQKQFEGTRMPEQSAFEKVIRSQLDHIKILYFPDSYLINATIYTLTKDSFLVHFMGVHTPEWMIQLMNDHYPFPKPNETQWIYYGRINWLNQKYGLNIPSMKIAVITVLSGEDYINKVKLGTKTKEDYCKKNGYDFIGIDLIDLSIHSAWYKIISAKEYLNKYDFIWILDADTMIFNENIKLEKIITDYMWGKEILATRDVSGEINTGSIFYKNSSIVNTYLEKIWESREQYRNKYWEQDAFNNLYKNDENFRNICSILETEKQTIFNCPVGLYKKDIFMIHFYGPSDINWVNKAMKDFYPQQRDDENEDMYRHRKMWLENSFK